MGGRIGCSFKGLPQAVAIIHACYELKEERLGLLFRQRAGFLDSLPKGTPARILHNNGQMVVRDVHLDNDLLNRQDLLILYTSSDVSGK